MSSKMLVHIDGETGGDEVNKGVSGSESFDGFGDVFIFWYKDGPGMLRWGEDGGRVDRGGFDIGV